MTKEYKIPSKDGLLYCPYCGGDAKLIDEGVIFCNTCKIKTISESNLINKYNQRVIY